MNPIQWLNGKKSYLGFLGIGALGLLTDAGIIKPDVSDALYHLLVAWTGIAVSHKLAKLRG